MPVIDKFESFDRNVPTGSAENAVEVTPSDANELPKISRSIYVGGDGDLRIELKHGDVVTLSNVKAGVPYPLRCKRVLATGTTATGIVALW